jgi:hypothetical protein
MHFNSLGALLLLQVPELNHSINTGRNKLEAIVKPLSLDQSIGVALERSNTLLGASVPYFQNHVSTG